MLNIFLVNTLNTYNFLWLSFTILEGWLKIHKANVTMFKLEYKPVTYSIAKHTNLKVESFFYSSSENKYKTPFITNNINAIYELVHKIEVYSSSDSNGIKSSDIPEKI